MEQRRPGQSEVTKSKEKVSPELVVYAGTSNRRLAFIKHAFPTSEVTSIPAGEEPDIPDVVSIMHGKIDNILGQLKENPSIRNRQQQAVIIAADTRTNILTKNPENFTYIDSRGKPKQPDTVRKTFEEMYTAGLESGVLPYYTVLSGSGVHIRGRKYEERLADIHACTVELNPDQIKRFSTPDGYEEYTDAFNKFYSSDVYKKGGLSGVKVDDLSGGLSLPVLTSLNAVEAVDGIERNSSDFEEAFRHGMYTVSVGISPHILRPVQPEIDSSLASWDWLNGVVDHTLR